MKKQKNTTKNKNTKKHDNLDCEKQDIVQTKEEKKATDNVEYISPLSWPFGNNRGY